MVRAALANLLEIQPARTMKSITLPLRSTSNLTMVRRLDPGWSSKPLRKDS